MNHQEVRSKNYDFIRVMASHTARVLNASPDTDVSEAVRGILRASGVTATPEMLVFARDEYVAALTRRAEWVRG